MRELRNHQVTVALLTFWFSLLSVLATNIGDNTNTNTLKEVSTQNGGAQTERNLEHRNLEHRAKRQLLPLVYPFGGTYKLLIGFAMPVHNEDNINLLFAANFQYQYLQVQNITSVSQYYSYLTVSRGERAADAAGRRNERLVFYRACEEMLSSKGFNGRECVLRAICEAAQYPVEEEGLVGEIIHILLTPNYGRTAFDRRDSSWLDYQDIMADYLSAQTAGSQMFHCAALYSGCPEGQGVLELISKLRDE